MLRRDATVRPAGDWMVVLLVVGLGDVVVIGAEVGVWGRGLLRSRSGSVAQSVDELSGLVSCWLVGLCVRLVVVLCLVVLCSMVLALTTVLELFGLVVPLAVVVVVVVEGRPGRVPLAGSTVVGLLVVVRLPGVVGCGLPL